jgi:hypothetical protein
LVFLVRSFFFLLFAGPALYQRHSPHHSTKVEKNVPANFPRRF